MKFPDNKFRYCASDIIIYLFSDLGVEAALVEQRSSVGTIKQNGLTVLLSPPPVDVLVGSLLLWAPKPRPTTLHVDNSTAVCLANDTLKIARSKAVDMRFHLLEI